MSLQQKNLLLHLLLISSNLHVNCDRFDLSYKILLNCHCDQQGTGELKREHQRVLSWLLIKFIILIFFYLLIFSNKILEM